MSQLQLYNYFRSSTSFRVRIALHLKNLPFDYMPVHLLNHGGEQNAAQYRELNPIGEVPSLVDGDFVLAQSFAIIEYLDEKYPTPPLFPKDIKSRALVRQMCENINCSIHPLHNLKVLKYLETELGATEEQKQKWISHWIQQGLAATEKLVRHHKGTFAFGDDVTAADLFIVPQLFTAQRFKVDTSNFINLQSILTQCMQLESFKRAEPQNQPDTP